MPKAKLFNMAGENIGEIELSEAIFGVEPNKSVLHDVVKNHLANCRQGTQSALTKGEVSYPLQSAEGGDGMEGGGAAGGEEAGGEADGGGQENGGGHPAPGSRETAVERERHQIAQQKTQYDAGDTAEQAEEDGFAQELTRDVARTGAQRPPRPDFARPLFYRDQQTVHQADRRAQHRHQADGQRHQREL